MTFRRVVKQIKQEDDIGELAEKSWENYLSILDNIALKEKMNLPACWVWDIINEFVYQLYVVCRWRGQKQRENQHMDIWQPNKAKDVLKGLYVAWIEDGRLVVPPETSCRDLFAYYSLVGHFRVEV